MSNNLPYILRQRIDSDNNFIYNSWLKSYRRVNNFVTDTVYFSNQKSIIEFLLSKSSCLVAVFPDAPEEIIGYVIYSNYLNNTVIHYIYIRHLYRLTGLGKQLFNSAYTGGLNIATSICKGFHIFKNKFDLIYDPYLITTMRLENNRGSSYGE